MAKFNGSEFVMYEAGSPNKRIADTRDLTITISRAAIDVTTRDSGGWTENIYGVGSWTASATGVIDMTQDTAETSVNEILAYEIAKTAMSIVAGTGVATDQKFAGTAIVTNIDWATPSEDAATWTASLTGSGPLVVTTGAVS